MAEEAPAGDMRVRSAILPRGGAPGGLAMTADPKVKHVRHHLSKVSEVDGVRTIRCVDCNEMFAVRIDGWEASR